MAKIKVLLVDDHALFREGLRFLLEDQQDKEIEVIGEAEDGLEAVRLVPKLKPSVILMDINMPVLDGVEATRLILKDNDSVGIIILTMIMANFTGLVGLGPYFPWAIPGLLSAPPGADDIHLNIVSYIILFSTSILGLFGTLAWWRFADQK